MSDDNAPASADLGSGERLLARLRAAEDVCVMFGWGPSTSGAGETDRQKATHELWVRWLAAGGSTDPKDHPHLTDELVAELAAKRDAYRDSELRALTAGGES